jgi:hypothetical protein
MGRIKFSVKTVAEGDLKKQKLVGIWEKKTVIIMDLASLIKETHPKLDIEFAVRIKATKKETKVTQLLYEKGKWGYMVEGSKKVYSDSDLTQI